VKWLMSFGRTGRASLGELRFQLLGRSAVVFVEKIARKEYIWKF
jgi:hypothetical protein